MRIRADRRGLRRAPAAALACGLMGAVLVAAAPASAQDGRLVPAETLLVLETEKGRTLIELYPGAAPGHVERIRTLADAGFYDGHAFHRVLRGFMAQTGDPQGTGAGGSDLPDLAAEFAFRRGRDAGFAPAPGGGDGLVGLAWGALPVQTQPDAQMMVTADFRVPAGGLFCSGVLGMARAGAPNSANSQFFIMTGRNDNLNGAYTAFGRVLDGLAAIEALKAGSEAEDGRVDGPDRIVRLRTAAALPEGQRPTVRVGDPSAAIETARGAAGADFSICDVAPVVQLAG